ncbi:hypothetical protein [Glaciimonas soli]|uniref:Uncharacterized protein n=1 Tax=Glaciimonas soli TaxID=2590999 RepID=A0A843YRH8_9BURK|nr:hypothetical protein [Glaciimonas soli]MQR00597.1 hypothetical protein [Glaciimonas soli]
MASKDEILSRIKESLLHSKGDKANSMSLATVLTRDFDLSQDEVKNIFRLVGSRCHITLRPSLAPFFETMEQLVNYIFEEQSKDNSQSATWEKK